MIKFIVGLMLCSCVGFASDIVHPVQPMDQSPEWIEIHGNGIYPVSTEKDAEIRAQKIASEIESSDMRALAKRTDQAIAMLIKVGVLNLRKRGFYKDADWMESQQKLHRNEVQRLVESSSKSIGDFEPISYFLAVAYETLEMRLGYQICYMTRLSDIKSLNFCIPVCFRPCRYPLSEFELHFIHDELYRGLAPVIAYWGTLIPCSIATFSMGIIFPVCSPLAMAVELVMDRALAPYLAPKIYSLVCD